MQQYKEEFIHFMIDSQVLKFGDFVTKSGRKTPFFVNTGFYRTGAQLKRLGEYYARAIMEHFSDRQIDIVFGPAYKGIPISVATAIALEELFGREVGYCSDRKEAKDHGEQGSLLGTPITDGSHVLLLEDVTTAGTSIRQTHPIITSQADGVVVEGLLVSVDRQEKGTSEQSALRELSEEYSMDCCAIVTMDEVVECLYNNPYNGVVYIDDEKKDRIDEYYRKYKAS